MLEYLIAIGIVAVVTVIAFLIFPYLELTNLVMVYLLGTLGVASRGHRGAAALAAILSVLCFNFFFVPPRFTFQVASPHYLLTFVVMFVVAMVISHLTIRLRSEAQAAREGQRISSMVHAFSEQLSSTHSVDEILKISVSHLAHTFGCDVLACLPGDNGRMEVKAHAGRIETISEKERGVVHWVFDTGQPAGLGTDSLPETDTLYLPLRGNERVVGVIRAKASDPEMILKPDQRKLMDSFAHQIGMALEVDRLQDSTKKAEVEAETERLRSSLLSSVSHDFRTPLTAIVGSASTLLRKEEFQKNPKSLELLVTIQQEGERLSHLVQNLLEATRLESGVQLRKELYPLEEIIGTALERLTEPLKNREIKTNIPENLPAVPLDGLLMEQVFVNLLENAVRHTPEVSPIEISVRLENDLVVVTVADRGPGLTEGDFERVFEKFYHAKASPGAGLGLAICRAVVKAHGGRIWAENRPQGGAAFSFTLPLIGSDEA